MSCTKRIISFDFDIVVKKKVNSDLVWSVHLLTMIFVTTVVKMLWLSPQKKENIVVIESTDQAKPWLIY